MGGGGGGGVAVGGGGDQPEVTQHALKTEELFSVTQFTFRSANSGVLPSIQPFSHFRFSPQFLLVSAISACFNYFHHFCHLSLPM